MGMLIKGKWTEEDHIIENGVYQRPASIYNHDLAADMPLSLAQEKDRFHLIASWSCPWSHRLTLMRTLKGLENLIPLHIAGGKRVQGYPLKNGDLWQVPGSQQNIVHLHQLYSINDPNYTGRSTVPILWDRKTQTIVSNESSKIMRALDAVATSPTNNQTLSNFTLLPAEQQNAIDALNKTIYENLSNAVYRASFATTQAAYDQAVSKVFATMDELEERLTEQRYLLGGAITEADWRLFPTLVRFDIDYFIHSRCSQKRLTEYPVLWAYARDLYSWRGVANTVNFPAIHLSNHSKRKIIPLMPHADWSAPHHREKLSPAQVYRANQERININPSDLSILTSASAA